MKVTVANLQEEIAVLKDVKFITLLTAEEAKELYNVE